MSELLKTPLFETHKALGGKMVPYAGWEMPVEYAGAGLRAEHKATREAIGLFDVSHMGEILVEGANSLAFLQSLLTNNVDKCAQGQAQYNMLLNENGGVIDDLIVYTLEKDKKYLLVVNASNKDKDWVWIEEKAKAFTDLHVEDQSASWAQIAVQGPKALDLVSKFFESAKEIKKFRFAELDYKDQKCLVSRTGYTGEDGFEIYGSLEIVPQLWNECLKKGKAYDLQPCGLGARNTLRIEAGFPLYGNEFKEEEQPWGLGMDWAIKMNKAEDFVGRSALVKGREQGKDAYTLIGLKTTDKAIPRDGYRVLSFDKEHIGHVTSGTFSPSLEVPIAMALVHKDYDLSKGCLIEIRQRLVETEVLKLPFI